MCDRWDFTVASLTSSSRAISRLPSPLASSSQDLHLARGQRRLRRRRPAHQRRRHRRRQHGLAAGGAPHGTEQLVGWRVLEQVAGGAGVDGARGCPPRCRRSSAPAPAAARAARAAGGWSPRRPAPRRGSGPSAPRPGGSRTTASAPPGVGRLAHHLEVGLAVEQRPHARPGPRDGRRPARPGSPDHPHAPTPPPGNDAATTVPSPGALSRASSPPSSRDPGADAGQAVPAQPIAAAADAAGSKPRPSSRTSRVTSSAEVGQRHDALLAAGVLHDVGQRAAGGAEQRRSRRRRTPAPRSPWTCTATSDPRRGHLVGDPPQRVGQAGAAAPSSSAGARSRTTRRTSSRPARAVAAACVDVAPARVRPGRPVLLGRLEQQVDAGQALRHGVVDLARQSRARSASAPARCSRLGELVLRVARARSSSRCRRPATRARVRGRRPPRAPRCTTGPSTSVGRAGRSSAPGGGDDEHQHDRHHATAQPNGSTRSTTNASGTAHHANDGASRSGAPSTRPGRRARAPRAGDRAGGRTRVHDQRAARHPAAPAPARSPEPVALSRSAPPRPRRAPPATRAASGRGGLAGPGCRAVGQRRRRC